MSDEKSAVEDAYDEGDLEAAVEIAEELDNLEETVQSD